MGLMGDEWVSTAIVLLVIVIMVVVWLPRRTGDSMRKVTEHRQDRHSPSLHLIDGSDGTRFSDGVTPTVKGVLMQPGTASSRLTRSRIVQVRRMRREAARRRRILVLSLLAVGVVALVALAALHISLWWSLVAFAPCLAVLGMGARVSAHAREWERMVARTNVSHTSSERSASPSGSARSQAVSGPRDVPDATVSRDETPTDVLEAGQIRQALNRARADRDREVARSDGEKNQSEAAAAESVAVEAVPESDSLAEVVEQDLISFSLGTAEADVVRVDGPESREIQSTRQVAKAVPQADHQTAAGFHEGELDADVDAPEPTAESLGTGIESILARRSK